MKFMNKLLFGKNRGVKLNVLSSGWSYPYFSYEQYRIEDNFNAITKKASKNR